MDIKEFIKQTIIGISEAVIEINDEKGYTGLSVCPPITRGNQRVDNNGTIIQEIEFNLCVEVSGINKAEAGLKIAVAKIGAESGTNNTARNNIKFTLPVAFPSANYKTYQQHREPNQHNKA